MSHAVLIYMVFLAGLLGGTMFLTWTGSNLPGPEEEKISLRQGSRNGKSRRAHYYSGVFFGK